MNLSSQDECKHIELDLDCHKKCKCKEPDFNDCYINELTDKPCTHCDICGGVP